MKGIKKLLKGLTKSESGQTALVMVLVLVVVGALIIGPLLGLMGTGLKSGEMHEAKTQELYAADAGVEDAIWKIQNDPPSEYPYSYPSDYEEPWLVNDKSVGVVIHREVISETACHKEYRYQILSTATGTDGSGTKIKAYVTALSNDYCGILDHIITIGANLTDKELDDLLNDLKKVTIPCPPECTNCEICGTVYDYNSDEYKNIPEECKSCVAVYNYPSQGWPAADFLSGWYWEDVENGTHYYGDTTINLKGNSCPPGPIYINGEAVDCTSGLGPLYIDGELTIDNSMNPAATLTLTGTLYVTGKTIIEPTKDLIIDLNGHTIFVESSATKPPKEALYIKGKCGVKGPGVIIAVGDVYFEPNIEAGGTDPVFIMSIENIVTLKPGVDFYGSVAGKVDVEPYPGTKLTYPTGGFGELYLNFPSLFEVSQVYSIASWQVSPL